MILKMRGSTMLWLGMILLGSPCLSTASSDVGVAADMARQSRPDFSGNWILNAKASDDPREKAKEAMRASRPARGAGSGSMGRGCSMGGGMGGGRQAAGVAWVEAAACPLGDCQHCFPLLKNCILPMRIQCA